MTLRVDVGPRDVLRRAVKSGLFLCHVFIFPTARMTWKSGSLRGDERSAFALAKGFGGGWQAIQGNGPNTLPLRPEVNFLYAIMPLTNPPPRIRQETTPP